MMEPFQTEKIETPAGEYTVEFIADEHADQPYDEGFGLLKFSRERVDVDEGSLPEKISSLVTTALELHAGRTNSYDSEYRSGAAILRYLRLSGVKGAMLVYDDYATDTPTSDRFDHVYGIAWAPDDVTPEHAEAYVLGVLATWRAWAEGDVFSYRTISPDGEEIDSCWGYYGFSTEREYVLTEARANAEDDARERVEKSNLVGAGFVGLI